MRGIPSIWVSVPSPVVRLAAGEQREVLVTIQPPPPPQGRAGRHQVVIRVTSQETPQQAAEATCTLTVAALEVPGRIGLLLAATEFPVAPGETVAIPLVLFNQGLEGDVVSLSVEGIPSSWVYASSASTPLSPGQQQEVTLTIQPPRSLRERRRATSLPDPGRQPGRPRPGDRGRVHLDHCDLFPVQQRAAPAADRGRGARHG